MAIYCTDSDIERLNEEICIPCLSTSEYPDCPLILPCDKYAREYSKLVPNIPVKANSNKFFLSGWECPNCYLK